MEDRRAFLTRTLALAALLPAGIAGAGAAGLGPDAGRGAGRGAGRDAVPGGLPEHLATLDVRALGGGTFLVSGWVLTEADLRALSHAA